MADTESLVPAREGRQPRAEAVQQERRRRVNTSGIDPTILRFGIDPNVLDHDKYVYRAALDSGMRLHQLTQLDDYDFVTISGEGARKESDAGVVKYRAGTVDGAPQYSYLLRKLKQFADEDRAERLRKTNDALKRRLSETPDDAPDKSYTPKASA